MAWSSDPQEPELIPRPSWYATPPTLERLSWAEWYDPYQERAGNDGGVGTLTATVKQIERVTAQFGGDGAVHPGVWSPVQFVTAAFSNEDSSQTGVLTGRLSAWSFAVRTVAVALSGLGVTTVTASDSIDGLSAKGFERYAGQGGDVPNTGTLAGSVFQKYAVAATLNGAGALVNEVHTVGGFPDGLSASAFPESDVIGNEDSEGLLDAAIYQVYPEVHAPNLVLDPSFESVGNSTAYAHTGTKSVLITGDHTNYLTQPLRGDWTLTPCEPGKCVTAEVWVRGDPANTQTGPGYGVNLYFGVHNSATNAWTYLGTTINPSPSLASGWTKMSYTATMPEGYNEYFAYCQLGPELNVGEKYYWDDPVVFEASLLRGSGSLSATVVPQRNSAPALAGAGAVSALAVGQYLRDLTLSNLGILSAITTQIYTLATVPFSSIGSLSVLQAQLYASAGFFTSEGILSGATFQNFIRNTDNIAITSDFENTGVSLYLWIPTNCGYSTEQAYEGTRSYKWFGNGGWNGPHLCLNQPVSPGESFTIKTHLRPHASNDMSVGYVTVSARFWNHPTNRDWGTNWAGDSGWVNLNNTAMIAGWQEHNTTAVAPAGAVAMDVWIISSPDTVSTNAYYVDTVEVTHNSVFQSGGYLSSTAVGQRNAAPALSGFGALTGTTTSQYTASVALTGSGALTATITSQYYGQSAATLSGGGTLSATAVAQYQTAPALSGGGTLSATAVKVEPLVDSHGYSTAVPGSSSSTMTVTYSHTFNATSTFILCVVAYYASGTLSPPAPGTITVGSTNMTLITSANVTSKQGTSHYTRYSWYKATGIAAGTQTVTASWTGLNTGTTKSGHIFGFGITGAGSPTWGGNASSGTTLATSWTLASGLNLTNKLTLAVAGVNGSAVGSHITAVSSPLVGIDEDIMGYVAIRQTAAKIPYANGTSGMSLNFAGSNHYWCGSYITFA